MLSIKKIKELRDQFISPSLSVSYKDPLHIVKGKGQYLYDRNGKKYLDAINNISHVGHCHPEVIKALYEQSKTLNTNTRYLHENIVIYAQELISTLPSHLQACFFTNSGSESNDLALRLARNYTNSNHTIVIEGAYHGHTAATIEVSPYKYDGPGGNSAEKFIHQIPMPDAYRGSYRKNSAEIAEYYIKHVQSVLDLLKNKDEQISAFISESILGCGGQIFFPEGFLALANKIVKKVGGICIADEVQVGFGRVGSHFWGFESENTVPDIITMGKSMGNGHPLSAVVTTKEIAQKFNNGMEYFNSFGGNPVSCAVGRTVLEIIEKEKLQKNAYLIGKYLIKELNDLKMRHNLIGDVRGRGLFLGIELIRDHEKMIPASSEADQIVNDMKDRGILISTDGPDHNVIKIKPPMVFTKDNADQLLDTLDQLLIEKKYN
ncbi:MAG: aminotransferase class III-fold pyridoxal phosphate-dependent enzyme [Candidatus Neomarinimicrobiota bacterium]|nr:aminotransferase class III-fold pyridoxal phosphate-dependent enzyme [Candidatus Neomarinimicrobiota bacterium]